MEVVMMAARVPMGIDFWASLKSPDRFDPAMIPVRERDWQGSPYSHSYHSDIVTIVTYQ